MLCKQCKVKFYHLISPTWFYEKCTTDYYMSVLHKWMNNGYSVCVDNCLVPLERTRCSSLYPMSFYFDSETGQCAEIQYGCSSSVNAFATLESCKMECSEHLASSRSDPAARGLQAVDIFVDSFSNNFMSFGASAVLSYWRLYCII